MVAVLMVVAPAPCSFAVIAPLVDLTVFVIPNFVLQSNLCVLGGSCLCSPSVRTLLGLMLWRMRNSLLRLQDFPILLLVGRYRQNLVVVLLLTASRFVSGILVKIVGENC